MIKGIFLDDTSVVTDIPDEFQFGYIRAGKIGKDDQKFAFHRDLLTAKGIPFGVFVELDYINKTDETTPVKQAENLAAKDRGFYELLPMIKIISKDGTPITDWKSYATLLSDTIYWYKITFGKRQVGISGNRTSLEALIPYMTSNISECWLDVIALTSSLPVLKAPYGTYPIWEQTLYDKTYVGATKVATALWPGTVAQIEAWDGSVSTIPTWDFTVDPGDTSGSSSGSTSGSATGDGGGTIVVIDTAEIAEKLVYLDQLPAVVDELKNINTTLQEIKQGFTNGWSL